MTFNSQTNESNQKPFFYKLDILLYLMKLEKTDQTFHFTVSSGLENKTFACGGDLRMRREEELEEGGYIYPSVW